MLVRDPVREGVQQKVTKQMGLRVVRRRSIDAQAAAPLLRGLVDCGEART